MKMLYMKISKIKLNKKVMFKVKDNFFKRK